MMPRRFSHWPPTRDSSEASAWGFGSGDGADVAAGQGSRKTLGTTWLSGGDAADGGACDSERRSETVLGAANGGGACASERHSEIGAVWAGCVCTSVEA